jgi:hypothetical protein
MFKWFTGLWIMVSWFMNYDNDIFYVYGLLVYESCQWHVLYVYGFLEIFDSMASTNDNDLFTGL